MTDCGSEVIDKAFLSAAGNRALSVEDVSQSFMRHGESPVDNECNDCLTNALAVATEQLLVETAENAFLERRNVRVLRGHLEVTSVAEVRAQRKRMAAVCAGVLQLADAASASLGVSIVLIFNARGGSPLAAAGRGLLEKRYLELRKLGGPTTIAFGSRLGEREAMDWLVKNPRLGAVVPISHFKISSRRFVSSPDALHVFGEPAIEAWRYRPAWSPLVSKTKEYIPAEFLDLCRVGMPIIFVDIASRRNGLATSCGAIESTKDVQRALAGAHDPYKLSPLLLSYGYSLSKAVVDMETHRPEPGVPVVRSDATHWCLLLNPCPRQTAAFWDNRPQLARPWGIQYSEYYDERQGVLTYVDTEGQLRVISVRDDESIGR